MHNSFDVNKLSGGQYEAISHNFSNVIGIGDTEQEAIDNMDRQIIYFADNNPKEFQKLIRQRINSGLECGCGKKLEGEPLGVKF